MKVKDLKANLAKASEDAEVVVSLDRDDIKKIAKLGSGLKTPGSGMMITDSEDAGLMAISSEGNSGPFEEIFVISVKKAIRKLK